MRIIRNEICVAGGDLHLAGCRKNRIKPQDQGHRLLSVGCQQILNIIVSVEHLGQIHCNDFTNLKIVASADESIIFHHGKMVSSVLLRLDRPSLLIGQDLADCYAVQLRRFGFFG